MGTWSYASGLPCVMPIGENGAQREKEQKGCADRDDQVDPEIPAVSLLCHECLYARMANVGP